MKLSLAIILAAAGSLAAGQHHLHRHLHPRGPSPVQVPRAEGTGYVYELDGQTISPQYACDGIENGSLKWAEGRAPPGACSTETSTPQALEFYEASTSPPSIPSTPSAPSVPLTTTPSPSSSSSPSSTPAPSYTPSSNTGESGVDTDFPDGQIDCGTFPSQFGPVPLEYLGLNGWAGLQDLTVENGVVTNIVTGVPGDNCQSGWICSYACPAGYQKSQWPSTQGGAGQSIGGLECQNGKLYLTNPSLSKKLCIPGVGGVSVQNTLGQAVSICRTDYPGEKDREKEIFHTGFSSAICMMLTHPRRH
jgi:SUN family beta-glucosidase